MRNLLGAALLLACPFSAQSSCRLPAINHQQSVDLRHFLAKRYYTPEYAHNLPNYADMPPKPIADYALRFSAASIPGTGLFAAYVSGTPFCGSGGCVVIIVRPAGHSFKVVGEVDMVFNPAMQLPTQRAGYPELGVWRRGYPDGGHEVAISYNGRRYELRETSHLSRDVRRMTGKTLIDREDRGCPAL